MLTAEQFEKAKQFIYRHGDLLTRRRFAYHFEGGSRQRVLDALACYQNDDGGFGNGLELDITCPASNGVSTWLALWYLFDLEAADSPMIDRAIGWVLAAAAPDGDVVHPADAVKAYPHGQWWEKNSGSILPIAGMLARLGKHHPAIEARAASVFAATQVPFPQEIYVSYGYEAGMYLRFGDGATRFPDCRERLEAAFPHMLQKAVEHPLFCFSNAWDSPEIPISLWRAEAERAVAALQPDGGVVIECYASLPWWRPVWTMDMLAVMKRKGLLV